MEKKTELFTVISKQNKRIWLKHNIIEEKQSKKYYTCKCIVSNKHELSLIKTQEGKRNIMLCECWSYGVETTKQHHIKVGFSYFF